MDKKREPISKKDLLEWRLMNHNQAEAAKASGWSVSSIRMAEKIHGIELPKKSDRAKVKLRKKPHPRLDELKDIAADGLNCGQIARIMGMSYDTVWAMAKFNGVKLSLNNQPMDDHSSYGKESLLYGIDEDVKRLISGKWR